MADNSFENKENSEYPVTPIDPPDGYNPDPGTPDNPTDPTEPDDPKEPDSPENPDNPDEPETPDRAEWSYKDIEDFYNRVRMVLGAVSENTVPDAYMDFPEKAPFAENYIKTRVPLWAELDDSKFAIFESVVVYQTAILFQSIVSNRHVRKKSIPTITLQYGDTVDFLTNGMRLDEMVDWLVNQLNNDDDGSNFFGFRVTETKDRPKRCCCGQRNNKW